MSSPAAEGPAHVDTTRVRVSLAPGRTKHVHLPLVDDPVPMGMHGAVASHYKVSPDQIEPHATTLDYLIGAAAGCLTGTFGGMLAALGQPTTDEHFSIAAEGDIVSDGGVLRIAQIRVSYQVKLADGIPREKVERAHDRHHRFCPIANSIGGCVEITSELELQ